MNSTFIKIFTAVLVIFSQSCVKDETLYSRIDHTIYEGSHNSVPLNLQKIYSTNTFEVSFTIKKGVYHLKNADGTTHDDQYDWNKLTGFSDCNYYDAYRGKGAMLGWRYNIQNKNFEFAAYVHKNEDKSFQAKQFNFRGLEGEKIDLKIEAFDGYYIYTLAGEQIVMDGEFGRGCSNMPITGRYISPWFGGNQLAPTQIEISIDYY
jgi:hypothetical protein